ncbi:MAG TPA: hypothetical protein P5026_07595 [Kiritimatiellia bacterium]|nr:hypothetical protein [Kiritimatiellia bacterium]HRU70950.1 hypothetical protein [Kiritimatiellia bacterium]
MAAAAIGIIGLFVLWFCVLVHERTGWTGPFSTFIRENGRVVTALMISLVVVCADTAVTKEGPTMIQRVFRVLFWDPCQPWVLSNASEMINGAEEAVDKAQEDLDYIEEATDSADNYTISFNWDAHDRLPYHERQNVLAWTPWVAQTNIGGTLYEDHYVEFNDHASTNPAVILIEYARTRDDGSVERYTSEVVTNSYPDTVVLEMQSGSHTCYWFRCAVPSAFVGDVRDWIGEALFGSPAGSGKGFDLHGTLVIDDGDDVWVGATTNHVIGGMTNVFENGINITPEVAFGGFGQ